MFQVEPHAVRVFSSLPVVVKQVLSCLSSLAERIQIALASAWSALSKFNNELDDALTSLRKKISEHLKFCLQTVTAMNILATLSDISDSELKQKQEAADTIISERLRRSSSRIMKCSHSLEDSSTLSGISICFKNYKVDQRHIIYFPGDDQIWQTTIRYLQLLHDETKANVFSYNYRGTGLSKGFPINEKVVIDDAMKQIQDLLDKGVEAKKIKLYGRSFGGAVATCIAAKFAEKNIIFDVISERSYMSLVKFVRYSAPLFLRNLLASLVENMGWVLDAESALKTLKGKFVCIYSEHDTRCPSSIGIQTAAHRIFTDEKEHQAIFYKMQESEFVKAFPQEAENPACTPHVRPIAPNEFKEIAQKINDLWLSPDEINSQRDDGRRRTRRGSNASISSL